MAGSGGRTGTQLSKAMLLCCGDLWCLTALLAPRPQGLVAPSKPRQRATKIVATIGPSTRDAEAMAALIDAGVDVARFNVKHNTKARRGAGRRIGG